MRSPGRCKASTAIAKASLGTVGESESMRQTDEKPHMNKSCAVVNKPFPEIISALRHQPIFLRQQSVEKMLVSHGSIRDHTGASGLLSKGWQYSLSCL